MQVLVAGPVGIVSQHRLAYPGRFVFGQRRVFYLLALDDQAVGIAFRLQLMDAFILGPDGETEDRQNGQRPGPNGEVYVFIFHIFISLWQ